jgi:hypothetical protein
VEFLNEPYLWRIRPLLSGIAIVGYVLMFTGAYSKQQIMNTTAAGHKQNFQDCCDHGNCAVDGQYQACLAD